MLLIAFGGYSNDHVYLIGCFSLSEKVISRHPPFHSECSAYDNSHLKRRPPQKDFQSPLSRSS